MSVESPMGTAQAPAEAMPLAEQSVPGLAARIGGAIRSGYEAVTDRIDAMKDTAYTLAAIGGIAFVGAQAAELTLNPEPVAAEGDVPALTGALTLPGAPGTEALATASDTTTSSDLEQECITDGMQPLKVRAAKMYGVHKQHGNGWHGHVKGEIDAMPQECTDNGYYRVLNYRVLLQNGLHRQHWSMIYPWDGSLWDGHRGNYGFVYNQAGYGVGPGFNNSAYQHNHKWTKYQYDCSPGPAKTGAKYQEMHTVIQTDGQVNSYGDTITGGPVHILAGPKRLSRPIKVYGAC